MLNNVGVIPASRTNFRKKRMSTFISIYAAIIIVASLYQLVNAAIAYSQMPMNSMLVEIATWVAVIVFAMIV